MTRYASLVGLNSRAPMCRVRIVREYRAVTKVRYWMGDGWSQVQDAHPESVVDDGGALVGWMAMRRP